MTKIIFTLFCLFFPGCTPENTENQNNIKGKLFIIGGGKLPASILQEMAQLAGINNGRYIYVLPMASSEPDSAIMWAKEDFGAAGIKNVYGFNFRKGEIQPSEKLDSVKNAAIIYISGGVQARFMDAVTGTPLMDAVHSAYRDGAVIAGTSAGAAVMGQKMITGEQLKYPGEDAGFTTIEEGNIEIIRGLGLLENVIIDQHFIRRQRLNRLIAVSIENPGDICAGIDESTALIVDGQRAKVTGLSQVIVLRNISKTKRSSKGLLGSSGLNLSVYLPGESFLLK